MPSNETVGSTAAYQDVLNGLRGCKQFEGLSDNELAPLGQLSQREVYGREDMILGPSDSRDGIFVVVEGAIRFDRVSAGGQEITLTTLRRGDIFGLSFVAARVQPRGVLEATEGGTVVVHIPREAFRLFVQDCPEVAMRVLDLLGQRVGEMGDRIEDLALHTVKSRVSRTLVELAQTNDQHLVRETRDRVAARVGTSREEVSRAISDLRRRQLVECPSPGVIIVPQPDLLKPPDTESD